MLFFESDYMEGAHEKILKRLMSTNMEKTSGYGVDPYCESAKKKIRTFCATPNADIYFLTGGTQTNQLIIDSLLAPYQGVIAAESGHISTHEAGAIECTGHKVLTIPSHNGKIDGEELNQLIRNFYEDENHEHMVFPGMVYISFPTEYGTLYSKDELQSISKTCHEHKLPLYIDGARLGYGLASRENNVTIQTIAELSDVFYIGGTKVGALFGEAVVFPKNNTPAHFFTQIKQHGALLAKGRILGIQFDTLFTDDLYLAISEHAIKQADRLRHGLEEKGYRFYLPTSTNQIFVVLENQNLERLSKNVRFSFWEKEDETHTVVRFATSWATQEEDITKLIQIL